MSDPVKEPTRAAAGHPWWRNPLPLGVLGLVLMLGGWKLADYVPPPEPSPVTGEPGPPPPRGIVTPPYSLPARLGMLAGTVLFVAAGVMAYRQAPTREKVVPPDEEDFETSDLGPDEDS